MYKTSLIAQKQDCVGETMTDLLFISVSQISHPMGYPNIKPLETDIWAVVIIESLMKYAYTLPHTHTYIEATHVQYVYTKYFQQRYKGAQFTVRYSH